MEIKAYQDRAMETAVYPQRGNNLAYAVLGLCNESGELAGKLKKTIRDFNGEITPEMRTAMMEETGDCCWYIAAVCHELGYSMNDVMVHNLAKLKSRQERGVLHGSGDNR